MYLNACQKYIEELNREYGPLLKRQIISLSKLKFKTKYIRAEKSISQLCLFSDFEEMPLQNEILVKRSGQQPDFDVIRSVEVMLSFRENIVYHSKGTDFVSVRFFVNNGQEYKEICVVPVKEGDEKITPVIAKDKLGTGAKAVFLLDKKEQLKLMRSVRDHSFAVIGENGAEFFMI